MRLPKNAPPGSPTTPDQKMVQILHAAEHNPPDAPGHLYGHGIDRKISSPQILFQPVGKLYLLWMSAVLICTIDPVGRHLKAVLTERNRNRSMLDPCINRPDGTAFLSLPALPKFVISQSCGRLARIEALTQPPTANASIPMS